MSRRAPVGHVKHGAEAAIFAALAHPTRREVLLVINFRDGAMTAGEIAARFSCRWPTVTRHLCVLESSGLLSVTKRGRTRTYRLNRRILVGALDGWARWFRGAKRA